MAGMLIKSRLLILSAAWSLIAGTVSFAEVSKESVLDNLKGQISKQYPGARIEINSEIKWTQGSAPSDFSAIQVTGDNQRGEIYFSVHNTENGNVSNGAAAFSAFVPTFTALRRVLPGERLSPEMFSVQDVNIATGQRISRRALTERHGLKSIRGETEYFTGTVSFDNRGSKNSGRQAWREY